MNTQTKNALEAFVKMVSEKLKEHTKYAGEDIRIDRVTDSLLCSLRHDESVTESK